MARFASQTIDGRFRCTFLLPVLGLLSHTDLPDAIKTMHPFPRQNLNLPQLRDTFLDLGLLFGISNFPF